MLLENYYALTTLEITLLTNMNQSNILLDSEDGSVKGISCSFSASSITQLSALFIVLSGLNIFPSPSPFSCIYNFFLMFFFVHYFIFICDYFLSPMPRYYMYLLNLNFVGKFFAAMLIGLLR